MAVVGDEVVVAPLPRIVLKLASTKTSSAPLVPTNVAWSATIRSFSTPITLSPSPASPSLAAPSSVTDTSSSKRRL